MCMIAFYDGILFCLFYPPVDYLPKSFFSLSLFGSFSLPLFPRISTFLLLYPQ